MTQSSMIINRSFNFLVDPSFAPSSIFLSFVSFFYRRYWIRATAHRFIGNYWGIAYTFSALLSNLLQARVQKLTRPNFLLIMT